MEGEANSALSALIDLEDTSREISNEISKDSVGGKNPGWITLAFPCRKHTQMFHRTDTFLHRTMSNHPYEFWGSE